MHNQMTYSKTIFSDFTADIFILLYLLLLDWYIRGVAKKGGVFNSINVAYVSSKKTMDIHFH